MIYIACPFWSDDVQVRYFRTKCATRYAAMLVRQGRKVFSPLTHSVPIADEIPPGEVPEHRWLDMDMDVLRSGLITELHVLQMPGWEKSTGVTKEMRAWLDMGKEITFITEWRA